ncbi:MAG: lysophospholipid acyltransferase family protein [Planctomycetota bacterium]
MKLNGPLVTSAASLPLYAGVRAWMSTLRCRVWYRDPTVDPALFAGPPRLYLFWHEGILLPLHFRGGCNIAMLLSQHRDADYLARIAGRFGFETVRGSTQRGGARALRELARKGRNMHLTITPDGPRGPRRVCAAGPIYLASRLQMPIVCMGYAYQHPWRMRSWDQFAVPKPFSRARGVVSEAIHVPAELDRDGVEAWRRRIGDRLNEAQDEAQAWANSGAKRAGERPMVRAGASTTPPPPSAAAA